MSKKKTQTFSDDYLEFNGTGKEFFRKVMIAKTEKDKEMLLEYTKGDRKNLSHKQAYEIITYMIRNPTDDGFHYILRNLLYNLCSDEFFNFLEQSIIDVCSEFLLDEAEYLDFKEFVILGHVPLMESVHLATIIKRLTDFTKEMEEEGETGIIPKMVKGIEQQKIGQILKYVTVYDLLHPFRKNDKETRLTNAIKTLEKNVSSDIQGSSLDEDVREIMFEERKKEMWIANKDLYIEEYKKRIKVIEELDTSDPDFGKNLTKVSINIS